MLNTFDTHESFFLTNIQHPMVLYVLHELRLSFKIGNCDKHHL